MQSPVVLGSQNSMPLAAGYDMVLADDAFNAQSSLAERRPGMRLAPRVVA